MLPLCGTCTQIPMLNKTGNLKTGCLQKYVNSSKLLFRCEKSRSTQTETSLLFDQGVMTRLWSSKSSRQPGVTFFMKSKTCKSRCFFFAWSSAFWSSFYQTLSNLVSKALGLVSAFKRRPLQQRFQTLYTTVSIQRKPNCQYTTTYSMYTDAWWL